MSTSETRDLSVLHHNEVAQLLAIEDIPVSLGSTCRPAIKGIQIDARSEPGPVLDYSPDVRRVVCSTPSGRPTHVCRHDSSPRAFSRS